MCSSILAPPSIPSRQKPFKPSYFPTDCPISSEFQECPGLVKIEGPAWYTIYHHLPVVKGGFSKPLFFHPPTDGNLGHPLNFPMFTRPDLGETNAASLHHQLNCFPIT
jgi:hypothetical protein